MAMKLIQREKRKSGTSGPPAVVVTDDGLSVIERMAANGNADATIAKALGINRKTLSQIRDRDERVDEAMQTGRAQLADELTDILLTHAREGNVTAAIYLSKARLGWRDQGPAPQATAATQVNIHIPAAMSDADFQKMIEVKNVQG